MIGTLEAWLRPNRWRQPSRQAALLPPRRHEAIEAAGAGLRHAVQENLVALLAGHEPVAFEPGPITAILPEPGAGTSVAGYSLADWQSGHAADGLVADELMEKQAALAVTSPLHGAVGAQVALPLVLRDLLVDTRFRHALGEQCRRFLCERVLFHPGDPPVPLFTPAGLMLLVVSQDAHRRALGAQAAWLAGAALALRDMEGELAAWDQWLVRRMLATPGWDVPDDLAALPWVAWRPSVMAPVDTPKGMPPYWRSILDLVP